MVLAKMLDRLADLHAWGLALGGQWWALLSWSLYGQLPGHNGHINRSGWVPASTVHQSTNPEEQRKYLDVPRLAFPAGHCERRSRS